MKKLFIVLAIVLAMASVVNAGAYTVRKGDCLSIIAQKHGVSCQALLKANKDKIKNVDLIFQKQILRIPEKVKVVVASATAETFLWKKAGANSFGKRNFFKAINLFNLPKEVKQAFVATVKEGRSESEDYRMERGQKFEQMIFGNYRIVNNVIVQIAQAQSGAKKYAKCHFGGQVYFLVCPTICGNWAWWKEKEEAIIQLPIKSEVVATVTTKEFEATATALPERVNVVVTEVKVPLEVVAGFFSESFKNGNNVSGKWGVGTVYYLKNSNASYGLAVENNSWSGRTGDGYDYKGSRLTIGPAFRYSNLTRTTTIRVGLGERNDSGATTGTGKYESEQRTNIVSAYFSNEVRNSNKWFGKTRVAFSEDIGIGASRSDSWTDATGKRTFLRNPAEDQSMVCAGVDSEVFSFDNNKNVVIGAGVSAIYYFRNANLGKRAEIGFYFLDRTIEIKSYYTDWSKSASSVGGTVIVNVSNLLKSKEVKEVKNAGMDRSADVLKVLGN